MQKGGRLLKFFSLSSFGSGLPTLRGKPANCSLNSEWRQAGLLALLSEGRIAAWLAAGWTWRTAPLSSVPLPAGSPQVACERISVQITGSANSSPLHQLTAPRSSAAFLLTSEIRKGSIHQGKRVQEGLCWLACDFLVSLTPVYFQPP